MGKKVIYIAGPIKGVSDYRKTFQFAADIIERLGYIALTPSSLPEGMSAEQYMRICFAMIDDADGVVFLPGSENSLGAMLEQGYCDYIGKPHAGFPESVQALTIGSSIWRSADIAEFKERLEVLLK